MTKDIPWKIEKIIGKAIKTSKEASEEVVLEIGLQIVNI